MLQGSAIRRQPIPHEAITWLISLQQDDWMQFKPGPGLEAFQGQMLPDHALGAIRCQFERLHGWNARNTFHFDKGLRQRRQGRKLGSQSGCGNPAAIHQHRNGRSFYAQGSNDMITGDAIVNLVVKQNAFLPEPAPPGNNRLLVEHLGFDEYCADLYRRAMHRALDPIEVGLLLLGTSTLDIADPDRCGAEDKRCKQGDGTRCKKDLQASRLWQGER